MTYQAIGPLRWAVFAGPLRMSWEISRVGNPLPYDALLLVSFGGPEGPDDVIPFLENVLRGKPVPRERMLEVAEHYQHFGGVSPINEQNRALISALETALREANISLPIYWGNRNWKPYLPEAIEAMKKAGVQKALAVFTSMYSSYSGCRQYRENLIAARDQVGEGAPSIDKLRFGFNHPDFIEAVSECVQQGIDRIEPSLRDGMPVLFTAHSIPLSMAQNCDYEKQLRETMRLVAERLQLSRIELVYQSRSGPPQQPWLEPDVLARIEALHGEGVRAVVVSPIGFISDHMEVMYDLDCEAKDLCERLGIEFSRAPTVGVHPKFIRMIVALIQERLGLAEGRSAVGSLGAWHDICPVNCCRYEPNAGRPAMAGGRPTAGN